MNCTRSGFIRILFSAAMATFVAAPLEAQHAAEIPQDQLVQPAQLHQDLESHAPLLVFQVGSRVLYDEAHIPGAAYAGPGSSTAGIALLRQHVKALPRSKHIVLYCGCCPWDKCPNIAPAWQLLHRMGFTHVRALYIADNFGADWVQKGYRVETSQ